MKSSTARASSQPITWTTNAAASATARDRTFLPKSSTMSPELSPPKTTSYGTRRSSTVPIRQATAPSRTGSSGSRKASPQRRSPGLSPPTRSPALSPSTRSPALSPQTGSPLEGNSPNNGGSRSTSTTRRQSPATSIKGFNSPSSQTKKQILSHDFLSKTTPKSRGQSMLTRSIDEPTGHQLRRQSAPPSKSQDYMSKSHDHGSLASYRSSDRGPKYLSTSQDCGPKSLNTSQDRGPRSLNTSQDRGSKNLSKSQNRSPNRSPNSVSKSQDRGFMSKSQDRGLMSKSHDRGSLSGYANQGGAKKVSVPQYGFDGRRSSTDGRRPSTEGRRLSTDGRRSSTDGRRLSTGSRGVRSQAQTIGEIKAHYQGLLNRRDGVSLQLQMGRSVDSTVSLSTATSSQRQSFRDTYSERSRLSPLQSSDPIMSQGYRSGDLTPEETSPLDGRAPASGLRTKHRQLKSPDFFDVKKVDGANGGVITAVSRLHLKANGVGQAMGGASEPEEHDAGHAHKLPHSGQNRRESLAGSARKAFSVETDSTVGGPHFGEIGLHTLEKELSGAQDLLEIGSWNEDDEEYLRIYKGERSAEGSFVDILEDTTSESGVAASKSSHVKLTSASPNRVKKKAEFSKIPEVGQYHGQYDNALYDKSEPESDLGTSTQPSPQASPPRGLAKRAASATKAAAVSRISSNSATSIDLNRSTDTTCSTHSQYDNAFWNDPPINGTFRPWNPQHEAEMTPAAAPARPSPEVELPHPQESSVLGTGEPVPNVAALNVSRSSRYNDGLERLTSYMKIASKTARKKRGLSDDMSSSQASGCFDHLVDFLESQQSITDVLVSAHDETLTALSAVPGNMTPKRLENSKLTNDATMLSNRSIESRITDLGSEASWESGKSRSVQTLGTTGKVMDQITEKVAIDSLSFDSPKHLSTFKFGLKKTTGGAFETITSSDQLNDASKRTDPASAPSDRSFPQRAAHLPVPQSPSSNVSWRSQTAPSSHNPSRNPSRNLSRNPSRTPSQRNQPDEKPAVNGHRDPSPLSTPRQQIKIVSEAGVESRREEEVATPAASPSMSDNPPVTEFPRKESPRKASPRKAARQVKKSSVEKKVAEPPVSPTVEAPVKDVQMHSRSAVDDGGGGSEVVPKRSNSVRLVQSASMKLVHSDRSLVKHDRDSLSISLNQANKGCGCTIL